MKSVTSLMRREEDGKHISIFYTKFLSEKICSFANSMELLVDVIQELSVTFNEQTAQKPLMGL